MDNGNLPISGIFAVKREGIGDGNVAQYPTKRQPRVDTTIERPLTGNSRAHRERPELGVTRLTPTATVDPLLPVVL